MSSVTADASHHHHTTVPYRIPYAVWYGMIRKDQNEYKRAHVYPTHLAPSLQGKQVQFLGLNKPIAHVYVPVKHSV